ncbi:alpha-acetolactate decarboxylase [Coniochaeta ligniaria NRRL 30616]|uniref:Alpha-acetolactate decarboxylase n=1 Tax=Coniochaeta ligniaria NRRL 30616 TaxID=1408157 RepID=A0A1J7J637_9PEZI|nr:alpha-acetolactate decarboxylase [Coniochaeta ligniaria NRRL 30616]
MANELFQYSIITALMDGVASNGLPIATLLSHGNHGLGTFRYMRGEMIILDGKLYQMKSDGTVTPIDPSSDDVSPFAMVTQFEATVATTAALSSKEEVSALLKRILPESQNHFMAVRLDGNFKSVTVRTAAGQTEPRQSLREVGKNQTSHTFESATGTIVGFLSPQYMEGIGVPGIHLHFITEDRKQGGHILALETGGEVQVQAAALPKMHLELPVADDEFNTAPLIGDAAGVAAVEG